MTAKYSHFINEKFHYCRFYSNFSERNSGVSAGLEGFNYRYHFNNKETDNEVIGEGNSYDFGARMYDSRLGRWWSVDALQNKYPNLSPYHLCANNPVFFVDHDGKDFYIIDYSVTEDGADFQSLTNIVSNNFNGYVTLSIGKTTTLKILENGAIVERTYTQVIMTIDEHAIAESLGPTATADQIKAKKNEIEQKLKQDKGYQYLDNLFNTHNKNVGVHFKGSEIQAGDAANKHINPTYIENFKRFAFQILIHEIEENVSYKGSYFSAHWEALKAQANVAGYDMVINALIPNDFPKSARDDGTIEISLYKAVYKSKQLVGYNRIVYSAKIHEKKLISDFNLNKEKSHFIDINQYNSDVKEAKERKDSTL